MPTIFELFGFRFYFYSNEHLPIHVHIIKGDKEAKFELQGDSFELVSSYNMQTKELNKLEKTANLYKEEIIEAWHNYFNK